MTKMCLAA